MAAQGTTIPLKVNGRKIGHVAVVQDLEGGLSIQGGSFGKVEFTSAEFINLSHVEIAFFPPKEG
jgi:hypothetical protein